MEPKRRRSKSALSAKNPHSDKEKAKQEQLVFDFDEDLEEIEARENSPHEMDDFSNLVIVTSAPGRSSKNTSTVKERRYVQPHSRKGSNETSAAIEDGLYFYEQDLRQHKSPKSYEISANVTMAPIEEVIPPELENVHIYHAKLKKKKPNRRRKARAKTPKASSSSVGWIMKNENNNSSSSSVTNQNKLMPSSSPVSVNQTPSNRQTNERSPKQSPGKYAGHSPSPRSSSYDKHAHPSHSLLENNGFVQQKYDKYRARCLKG